MVSFRFDRSLLIMYLHSCIRRREDKQRSLYLDDKLYWLWRQPSDAVHCDSGIWQCGLEPTLLKRDFWSEWLSNWTGKFHFASRISRRIWNTKIIFELMYFLSFFSNQVSDILRETLEAVGAKAMVVGHTPQLSGVNWYIYINSLLKELHH